MTRNNIYITNAKKQEINLNTKRPISIDVGFNHPVYVQGAKYEGKYSITPNVFGEELPTKDRTLEQNIQVKAIPTYEVSNAEGTTFIIGEEVKLNGLQ